MTANQPLFRDQLLAVDPLPDSAQQQLEQELQTMLHQELTTPRKILHGIVSIFSVIMAGVCAFLLFIEDGLPTLARVTFVLGILFSLGWLAVMVRTLQRGYLEFKLDGRRIAQMVWGFVLVHSVIFTYYGMSTMGTGNELKGLLMIGQSLMFLIGAAVYWISYRIEEAEVTLKEQLLRLEMHVARQEETNG